MVNDTEEIICREFTTRFNSTKSALEKFIENSNDNEDESENDKIL